MFGKKSMKVSDVFTDESTNAGIDVNLDNEPDLNAGYYQGTDIAYEESEVTFEPNPKPKRRGIGLFGSKKRNQRDDMHDLYESVSQQKVVAQRRDVPFMSKHSINPEMTQKITQYRVKHLSSMVHRRVWFRKSPGLVAGQSVIQIVKWIPDRHKQTMKCRL